MPDPSWIERKVAAALATVDAAPFDHHHQVVGTCRPCMEEAALRVARAVAEAVAKELHRTCRCKGKGVVRMPLGEIVNCSQCVGLRARAAELGLSGQEKP